MQQLFLLNYSTSDSASGSAWNGQSLKAGGIGSDTTPGTAPVAGATAAPGGFFAALQQVREGGQAATNAKLPASESSTSLSSSGAYMFSGLKLGGQELSTLLPSSGSTLPLSLDGEWNQSLMQSPVVPETLLPSLMEGVPDISTLRSSVESLTEALGQESMVFSKHCLTRESGPTSYWSRRNSNSEALSQKRCESLEGTRARWHSRQI